MYKKYFFGVRERIALEVVTLGVGGGSCEGVQTKDSAVRRRRRFLCGKQKLWASVARLVYLGGVRERIALEVRSK